MQERLRVSLKPMLLLADIFFSLFLPSNKIELFGLLLRFIGAPFSNLITSGKLEVDGTPQSSKKLMVILYNYST